MIAKDNIVRDVKIILDENEKTYGALDLSGNIEDPDQIETDTLIARLIHVAVDAVNRLAPIDFLADVLTKAESDVLAWEDYQGYCSKAVLPEGFNRLMYVRLPNWKRGISDFLTENDPLYAQFFSKYAGVRPTTLYPAAAIVPSEEQGRLEVVCCPKADGGGGGKVFYVATSDASEDAESFPVGGKCHWPVAYYVAHLYYTTLGEKGRADMMLTECYRRLDVDVDSKPQPATAAQ